MKKVVGKNENVKTFQYFLKKKFDIEYERMQFTSSFDVLIRGYNQHIEHTQ